MGEKGVTSGAVTGGNPLGLRACARELGISHVALKKHADKGHVRRNADGSFDLAAVRSDLRQNVPNSVASTPLVASQAGGAPDFTPRSDTAPAAGSLTEFRTKREFLKLQREALDFQERRGDLIKAADVRAAQAERATAEREGWLNWPARIAAAGAVRFGALERDLFAWLEDEVRKHLEERSNEPAEEKVA
jgi:hypothetical protein